MPSRYGCIVSVLKDPAQPAAVVLPGVQWCSISSSDLANTTTPWLMITGAASLPAAAAPGFVRYAESGGNLILLGGLVPRLNLTRRQLPLQLCSPYEPYTAVDKTQLMASTTAGSALLNHSLVSNTSSLVGLSAIGFATAGTSVFTPIIEGFDSLNRSTGFLLSLFENEAGAYTGGRWIFSCIVNEGKRNGFYTNPVVVAAISRLVTTKHFVGRQRVPLSSPSLPSPWPGARNIVRGGMIRLSSDRRHLVYADGSPYFIIGGDFFRNEFNNVSIFV